MPYIDAAVINVDGSLKSRLKALVGRYGQSEKAVLELLVSCAEIGLDIPKGIPSESCSSHANDHAKPRRKPCQDTASEST